MLAVRSGGAATVSGCCFVVSAAGSEHFSLRKVRQLGCLSRRGPGVPHVYLGLTELQPNTIGAIVVSSAWRR
jgi:hypothetical protein